MKFNAINLKAGFLIVSWALYDLANQFFALNIVSLYFVRWLTLERGVAEIFYGFSFGISVFLSAAFAPLLGTISDLSGRRRPFFVIFTLISIAFTMLLGISDNIILVLSFFAVANFACQMAVVFYNSLMVNIAPKGKIGLVSGFGRMLGYSGAILALYLLKPIVLKSGYQAAFIPTGLLFLLFALPCMLFVKDKPVDNPANQGSFLNVNKISEIFKSLKELIFNTQRYPGLLDFLKSAFFGLGVVNVVIIFMSVYATRVFGLTEPEVINLIAFSTVFAIAGSIFSGFISDYAGHKRSLCAVFMLWMVCLLLGSCVRASNYYWVIAALVGFALGATWVVSRNLIIWLIPSDKVGEVFGIFNLVGCLSAVAGALYWGVVILLLSRWAELGYRIALFSLSVFLLLAFVFILRVKKKKVPAG